VIGARTGAKGAENAVTTGARDAESGARSGAIKRARPSGLVRKGWGAHGVFPLRSHNARALPTRNSDAAALHLCSLGEFQVRAQGHFAIPLLIGFD
jgi:hypothetical protein